MTNEIPMIMDNGEKVPMIERPLYGDKTFKDPDEFLTKAKRAVEFSEYVAENSLGEVGALTVDTLYVVWFAKVLGNWKALISTDMVNGLYWEVTYNGNKKETYVDRYVKSLNTVVPD